VLSPILPRSVGSITAVRVTSQPSINPHHVDFAVRKNPCLFLYVQRVLAPFHVGWSLLRTKGGPF